MKPIVSLRGKSETVRSLRIAVVVYLLAVHGFCLSQSPAEADHVQASSVDECPVARAGCGSVPDETNNLIQALEQNRDIAILEVDELLTDNVHHYNDCYQVVYTFGGDDIISNLICNIKQLVYKRGLEFTFQHIRTILPVVSSVFILLFLRKMRWGSVRSSSITTLGICLGVSIFLVGLTLGPIFVMPEYELLKTKLWFEEVEYLIRSRSLG